jgi:starch synthase (maltosyl-transferring)
VKTTPRTVPGPPGRWSRVIIENVSPEVDGGRFPIKRTAGEAVVVEADAFTDGHDLVRCELLHRREGETAWTAVDMTALGNDRFRGSFSVDREGRCFYTVRADLDRFATWARDLEKRAAAGQDLSADFEIGARLLESASRNAPEAALSEAASAFREGGTAAVAAARDPELALRMRAVADTREAAVHSRELAVVVERERARFSSWYEMFPRSASPDPGRAGTLADCVEALEYVSSLGFDVLYLPPIHPIGKRHRKGPNNSTRSDLGDPGSPWAIGNKAGGHKAIAPELGGFDDFHRLMDRAKQLEIEVALDLAFQCSPDHPYVSEHPDWFLHRPDGTIQYAENPPKKYEDIYPFDFESADWRSLWEELASIVEFWIGHGIRIFRVDNPHTKPFAFWEWLIARVREEHPEVIFLAEAFTRPKVMYRLAKLGFSQSYTYFTWRNSSWEIAEYFRELTQPPVCDFFRPNLWPNTPDILTEYLQAGGPPAFAVRVVLASTLGANWGIFGPALEQAEGRAARPGSEEYLDSEKYQIRHWDRNRAGTLPEIIARLNRIRRENRALQSNDRLHFHSTDNPAILCYSKATADFGNIVLAVVNVDPQFKHSGWVDLDLKALGLEPAEPYQVHDLLTGARYIWEGARNYVELDPRVLSAHVFRVRVRTRSERDFDYYT